MTARNQVEATDTAASAQRWKAPKANPQSPLSHWESVAGRPGEGYAHSPGGQPARRHAGPDGSPPYAGLGGGQAAVGRVTGGQPSLAAVGRVTGFEQS